MSDILADGKIRIGILCFTVFLVCSIPSYGAPPQPPPEQPVTSDQKTPSAVTPATSQPPTKTPAKKINKNAPKEGVKDTKVGPAPANAPKPKKKLARRPQSTPPPGFVKLVPWENITTHGPLPPRP